MVVCVCRLVPRCGVRYYRISTPPFLTHFVTPPHQRPTALQALAVEKQRQEAANRNKIAAKQKALADKKKEHKAKASKHKETFGADYDEDDPDMDQYYDMEDSFM